jgi:hypothetical protein
MDDEIEWMNAIMEQYLQVQVNYLQDNWSEWLPLAEFAAHHKAWGTMGSALFFANKGFNPHCQLDLLAVAINDTNDW